MVSWIVGFGLAAIVVVFALSNRETVLIGFWPLADGLAAPIYLAVLLPFLAGMAAGWLAAGWQGWRRRRRIARHARQAGGTAE